MLRPANVVDIPILRALIREGALSGSFDPALASDARDATQFFTNLRQALASGYFVEPDAQTGELARVAVLSYVYLPDGDSTVHRPIGFVLLKATSAGYELWLTGIDAAWRGRGYGRKMLAALLDTPAGRKAYVARVKTYGGESPAMAHLLRSFGFDLVRETPQFTWYLRNDAPPSLRAANAGAPEAPRKAG